MFKLFLMILKINKALIIISLCGIVYGACTFDNEQDYFDLTCTTENMSYDSLTYIFTNICSQCHSSTFTYRTGIEMDTYESVVKSINTGLVMPAIKHEGEYLMPYNLSKLPDCDISKIEAWINDGMPK